jgi:hypothetical protein
VSPVQYELGFYIPEDDILHSHRLENLKSYNPSVAYTETANVLLQHYINLLPDYLVSSKYL